MANEGYKSGLNNQPLSERLSAAYKDISPNLRKAAAEAFCEYHKVTPDTFRSKRSGQKGYVVTLEECKWLENYKENLATKG